MADSSGVRLLYLVLCDGFATDPSTGKRSFYGLFDRLIMLGVPSTHPTLVIGLGLEGGEGASEICATIRNPKGVEIIRSPSVSVTPKEPYRREDIIVQINGLTLSETGRHEVQIMLKDKLLGTHPLFVEKGVPNSAVEAKAG